jgi:archaellum component FlaC
MAVNIIETVKEPTKIFHTVDEFNTFYSKNKEKMDQQTTHILNKLYHIDGYHITKVRAHEGLSLKKWEGPRYIKNDDMPKLQIAVSAAEQLAQMNETLSEHENQIRSLYKKASSFSPDDIDQMNDQIAMIMDQIEPIKVIPKLMKDVDLLTKDVIQLKATLTKEVKQLRAALDGLTKEVNQLRTALDGLIKYVNETIAE